MLVEIMSILTGNIVVRIAHTVPIEENVNHSSLLPMSIYKRDNVFSLN